MNQNVPMAASVAQQNSNIEIGKFHHLKEILKKMADDKKGVKTEHDKIQDQAVDKLLALNKRYVEVKKGEYAQLAKESTQPGLGKDKHEEFFNALYEHIKGGRINVQNMDQFTKDCTTHLLAFLSGFEKRKLKIEFKKQVRKKTCEDLKDWLDSAPNKA